MANKILSKNDLKFMVADYASSRVEPLPNEYVEYKESVTLKDGIIHRVIEPSTCKLSERDKGLKFTDYSIDSLQYAGALNDLQFSQLNGDRLGLADSMENNFQENSVENG